MGGVGDVRKLGTAYLPLPPLTRGSKGAVPYRVCVCDPRGAGPAAGCGRRPVGTPVRCGRRGQAAGPGAVWWVGRWVGGRHPLGLSGRVLVAWLDEGFVRRGISRSRR